MFRGRRLSVYSSSWSEIFLAYSEVLVVCIAVFLVVFLKLVFLYFFLLSFFRFGGFIMIIVDRRKLIKKVIVDVFRLFKEKFRLNVNILLKC